VKPRCPNPRHLFSAAPCVLEGVSGAGGVGEIAVAAGDVTEGAPDAIGVTDAAGAVGAREDVAVGVVGGCGCKFVGGRFSLASLVARDCVGAVSPVIVVCAMASEVSDRQAARVERT